MGVNEKVWARECRNNIHSFQGMSGSVKQIGMGISAMLLSLP